MISSHLAINTERRFGTTVSLRTVKNEVARFAKKNRDDVEKAIFDAMENRCFVVAKIDDYTTIH